VKDAAADAKVISAKALKDAEGDAIQKIREQIYDAAMQSNPGD
jgi:F0F1-type ATP synthase delta subunit